MSKPGFQFTGNNGFSLPHAVRTCLWGPGRFFLALVLVCLLSPSVDAETQASIKSAAEIDYPPFSMVDENGRADGFSVELMREALGAMNREVVFRTGPWAQVRSWLEKGEIQALPLVGRTPEREALFDFTFPYMSLHGAIVVRKDNAGIHDLGDLRGRQVAVMKGDNAEEFLRREDRGIHIHTTPTFEQALGRLSRGRYDAVVTQRLVALRLIQKTGLTDLKVIDRPIEGFRQDFCFAVREGDRDTLALLNEGLAIVMAEGTYRRLHAKWFAALQLPTDRPIVIGGDHNYPPFEYLDKNGRPAGFTVALTRAIAREMDINIQIRLGPWAGILERLRDGDIDAVQGIFYSPQRDRTLDFSQPYLISHYVSVVRRESGKPPETLEDLADLSIVVQKGDVIHDFLIQEGLGARTSVMETQEDVLRAVSEGASDCAIALRVSSLHLIQKNQWTDLALGSRSFFSGEYCYAVPKGHSALLSQFSEGLHLIKDSGEFHRIYEKWLGGYKEKPPSLLKALRYSAMVLVPLGLILLAIFLWTWSLRRRVREKTRELKESAEFQRAMIACSPVALYSIDLQGNVQAWNASAQRIFGWTAEEVMGKPLPIVPEDRQEEFAALRRRVTQTGGFSGVEVVRQRKDGTCFDASLSAGPIYNEQGEIIGIMASLEDVTERKQAETALRKSEIQYRSLFDHSLDAFLLTAPDGSILEVNPAACAMFQRTAQEIKKLGRNGLVDTSDPRLPKALEERAKVGKTQTELTMIRADNSRFPAEISSTIYADENGLQRSSMIIRDITERKQAEEDREQLQAQLNQAQKMESVGRLAGGVAHDFNNQLGVILGNAQMMLMEMTPEDPNHSVLKEIQNAAERSADLTRQLLAFARKQTMTPAVINLNDTIEGMLKMLRRLIGEDIDVSWEPATHLWAVSMDPSQIDQILANLCVNARDAITGAGKVTIQTENVVVDESYCDHHAGCVPGEYVLLMVSDDGVGMDEDTLKNVFDPFFTTKEVGKGTGLGLSTVYGIVKQNNGFVNVYSEPGQGTTFRVYLPRYGGDAREAAEAAETEMPQSGEGTILVVEDEVSVLRLTRRVLEKLGYTVLSTQSPDKALNMVREHTEKIHLLITDVVLPEMSGKELAEKITGIRPDIKVLFMSGYTADIIGRHGVLDEGVSFIEKPFSLDSLARKVREAMGSE